PGADATLPGALGEIGLAVFLGRGDDRTLDAHLAVGGIPVHHSGAPRIALELPPLRGEVVGVEHDVARLRHDVFAQNDARARTTVSAGRRAPHGFWHWLYGWRL